MLIPVIQNFKLNNLLQILPDLPAHTKSQLNLMYVIGPAIFLGVEIALYVIGTILILYTIFQVCRSVCTDHREIAFQTPSDDKKSTILCVPLMDMDSRDWKRMLMTWSILPFCLRVEAVTSFLYTSSNYCNIQPKWSYRGRHKIDWRFSGWLSKLISKANLNLLKTFFHPTVFPQLFVIVNFTLTY